jgi:Uma2 family endonuclease
VHDAEADIPEYWIVDPRTDTITVLTPNDAAYRTHGMAARGTTATLVLLDGFAVDITGVFNAA